MNVKKINIMVLFFNLIKQIAQVDCIALIACLRQQESKYIHIFIQKFKNITKIETINLQSLNNDE